MELTESGLSRIIREVYGELTTPIKEEYAQGERYHLPSFVRFSLPIPEFVSAEIEFVKAANEHVSWAMGPDGYKTRYRMSVPFDVTQVNTDEYIARNPL